MEIYEIKIKPKSAFITPLKGDTIFGALCCRIDKLTDLLKDYQSNPFLIVSSAFFKKEQDYIFKRPSLPSDFLFPNQNVENRKENDKKKYFVYSGQKEIFLNELQWAQDKYNEPLIYPSSLPHNTINRRTMTTGEGAFAPYSMEGFFFNSDISLAVFAAIDESRFSKENLKTAFEEVGKIGFGKRASIGYGQFDIEDIKPSEIFNNLHGAFLYALSPFVLSETEKADIQDGDFYFQPFTRYGKHGAQLAISQKPFKKPIITADEAAIIRLPQYNGTYIGSAITNVSDIEKETVSQGYALCLNVELRLETGGKDEK